MDNVYTCTCGSQTWNVLGTVIRCTACNTEFANQGMTASEFNEVVLTDAIESEEADFLAPLTPVSDFRPIPSTESEEAA